MGTKIYLAVLGILFVICLAIGFSFGYGNVFRPGAFSVPNQSMAQTAAVGN